jgi:hypothetical protein
VHPLAGRSATRAPVAAVAVAVRVAVHVARRPRAIAGRAGATMEFARTPWCSPATPSSPASATAAGTASTDDLRRLLCFDSRQGLHATI